ncbi:restriction endonuclease subunit S [Micromonospora narathiwatensis]|uniref:restriction endonuclease subunit S n=1 Tax=Micromonospora narathiwatensis TaxID=299146 RepID=UPI0012FE70A9|nr:restriction endonuclease subunit S [Micromonospora narathiwatensis]
MSKAERVLLGDLAEVTPGPSGSLLDQLGNELDGVPVVTPSDIDDRHQVDARKIRRLPHNQAARLGRFTLRQGDIVLVRQGSLGKLALIDGHFGGWLYNSSCARVRSRDPAVLPEYLCLHLSSPAAQEEMFRRALPGTVQSLNAKILGGLPIMVPSLDRQHDVIAAVADIDELTLVHRETARRLDAVRRALLADVFSEG